MSFSSSTLLAPPVLVDAGAVYGVHMLLADSHFAPDRLLSDYAAAFLWHTYLAAPADKMIGSYGTNVAANVALEAGVFTGVDYVRAMLFGGGVHPLTSFFYAAAGCGIGTVVSASLSPGTTASTGSAAASSVRAAAVKKSHADSKKAGAAGAATATVAEHALTGGRL